MVDIGVCQIAIKRPFTIPLKIFEESTIAALAVDPPSGDFEVFENILCYRLPAQGIKVETLVGVQIVSQFYLSILNFLLIVINKSIALLARRGWARSNDAVK